MVQLVCPENLFSPWISGPKVDTDLELRKSIRTAVGPSRGLHAKHPYSCITAEYECLSGLNEQGWPISAALKTLPN